jgi:hypothetical protein
MRQTLTEEQVLQNPHIRFSGGIEAGYLTLPYSGAYWNDRKLLVTGLGHSGTNLLTDMVRGAGFYNFTPQVEDRQFCDALLPLYMKNYATKLCIEPPYFYLNGFKTVMEKFPNLKVVVSLRHPVDQVLSCIYRELPVTMGGDSLEIKEDEVDHNVEHKIAMWNSEYFQNITYILNHYGYAGRSIGYKMEDLLLSTEKVARGLAFWLELPYTDAMAKPWEISRHEGQLHRYKRKLDKTQIDVYKRWKTDFNGFFADKRDMVAFIMENLAGISGAWGYPVDMGVL